MNIPKSVWVLGILASLAGGGFFIVRLRCAHISTTSMPYQFLKYQVYSAFLESSKGLGEQHLLIRNKSSEGDEPIVGRFSISMPYRLISDPESECAPDIDAIIEFSPIRFTDNQKTANFKASIMNGRCSYSGVVKKVTMRNVKGEWKIAEIIDFSGFAR